MRCFMHYILRLTSTVIVSKVIMRYSRYYNKLFFGIMNQFIIMHEIMFKGNYNFALRIN